MPVRLITSEIWTNSKGNKLYTLWEEITVGSWRVLASMWVKPCIATMGGVCNTVAVDCEKCGSNPDNIQKGLYDKMSNVDTTE